MKVQEFLSDREVEFDTLPHEETFDSQHLAQALHVSGREVVKTVLLRLDHGFRYAIAMVPAMHRVDLEAASQILGGAHTELATELEMAACLPDCELGSLPPFGSVYGMDTLLDESLRNVEQLVFGGNNHHEAIRMDPDDFMRIESPLVGDFARM